jgi:hypothetical protein
MFSTYTSRAVAAITQADHLRGRHAMTGPKERGEWTAVLLTVVLLAVELVIVAESWRGLTGFAHLIGITGRAAWGVPVTLDGVWLVAALVALRAELAGEASGLYPSCFSCSRARPRPPITGTA